MNKKIVILGAGESGAGSAMLAKSKASEYLFPTRVRSNRNTKRFLRAKIRFEEGNHSEDIILAASEVIKSPGIPEKAPVIQKLNEKNIPVISEIEFAGRYTNAVKICITGSNGKTTTTNLIWHMLKKQEESCPYRQCRK